MVKYVIFDFDGTLADSQIVFVAAWNQLAKRHNFKEINLEEFEAMKKLSIKERIRLLQFPMHKLPVFVPQFYKLYKESIKEIKPFHGVKELVSELEKRGYKIAVISSNSKENILYFLKRYKMENIKEVLCSNRFFGKDKLIHKFLQVKNLKPSEVIYIGDERRDAAACKKTGIKMVWVGWGYDAEEVVEPMKPDYKAYAPADILQVL